MKILQESIDKPVWTGRGGTSIEDAFSAYSQGMTVLKQCSDQIDRVEKRVLKLSENGQLEEFCDADGRF